RGHARCVGLLHAPQVVLVGDALGVARVPALPVAVPHVDGGTGERRPAVGGVEDRELDGGRHTGGHAAGRAEARPDVTADDAVPGEHVEPVGAVARVRARGLLRDLLDVGGGRRGGGRAGGRRGGAARGRPRAGRAGGGGGRRARRRARVRGAPDHGD